MFKADKIEINEYELLVFIKINKNPICVNLKEYIEDNADILKKDITSYLNFIKLNSNLYLKFNKNFKSDEYSSIFEGNYYKTKIDDLVLILAINKFIKKYKPRNIYIKSKNQNIYKSLKLNNKINYKLSRKFNFSFKFNNILYSTLVGFYCLFKIIFTFNSNRKKINLFNNDILISPLSNYSIIKKKNKFLFKSNLWGKLEEEFLKLNRNITYIHVSNVLEKKNKFLKYSNSIFSKKNNHIFFENNLSSIEKLILIKIYLINFFYSFTKQNFIKSKFYNKNLDINFWNILKKNFFEGYIGFDFFSNYVNFCNFSRIFKNNNHIKNIYYLYEFQNWERVILDIIKNNKQIKLYGIIHSSIRFWDLRFSFLSNSCYPNKFFINSNYNLVQLKKNGFLEENLHLVESLRFNEFNNMIIKRRLNTDNLIVFLDYSDDLSLELINFLLEYDVAFKGLTKFIFKKHINTKINLHQYKFKNYSVTNLNIENIFKKYSKCITSNMTTAQIDILENNLDLIVLYEKNKLNLSPLYKKYDIKYARNIYDLKNFMNSKYIPSNLNYFIKSRNYKLWKKAIN